MSKQNVPAVPADLTDEVSLKRFLLDLVSTVESQAQLIAGLEQKVDLLEKQVKELQAKP